MPALYRIDAFYASDQILTAAKPFSSTVIRFDETLARLLQYWLTVVLDFIVV